MNYASTRGIAYATIAALMTAGVGYGVGAVSHRWGSTADLKSMAHRLDQTQRDLPGWELASMKKLAQAHADMLQTEGELVRTYVKVETGERVSVAVLLGPAGPVSLHDPDVCYLGSGYRVIIRPAPEKFKLGDRELTMWSTVMESPELGGEKIKVVWAWNDGSGWAAPENARFNFAGKPYLFKVQAVAAVDSSGKTPALQEFLRDFLPRLDEQIVAP